ncbi:hypothetical protein LV84_03149 [Algoriphagus ratkowskyi]|uniref:PIN domain-containing protein n=1 Tax=Algoriphagus ratkowskyi TaxID=57028 RepID=A0A2W7RRI5_9BACT|nr:PIN domain-containing protein [Algoriphagus ratkowskyi]PZX53425.1 hypothetical protein LV84_03149 [Algoriphagus ratkowskyi]TXD76532.1 PIN domain-containing protein [Algoriphagus ratkowskyi]
MNRVIIDTSVWIEFFKANQPYFDRCLELIDNADIYSVELIFAELQQGAKGKREFDMINSFFAQMKILDAPGLIYHAGIFSREQKLLDRGIGLIDALIIFTAIRYNLKVWTLDKKVLGFLDEKNIFSG